MTEVIKIDFRPSVFFDVVKDFRISPTTDYNYFVFNRKSCSTVVLLSVCSCFDKNESLSSRIENLIFLFKASNNVQFLCNFNQTVQLSTVDRLWHILPTSAVWSYNSTDFNCRRIVNLLPPPHRRFFLEQPDCVHAHKGAIVSK